jgi:hypothetical protein
VRLFRSRESIPELELTSSSCSQFFISKVMKKVRKVKTPSFLGEIVVKEIDVGKTPP